jgi:hypothetical protein
MIKIQHSVGGSFPISVVTQLPFHNQSKESYVGVWSKWNKWNKWSFNSKLPTFETGVPSMRI